MVTLVPSPSNKKLRGATLIPESDAPRSYLQIKKSLTEGTTFASAVHLGHVSDQIKHLVRVADLVVVPRNHLHELIGQVDAGVSVEDRGQCAAEEVGRNDRVLRLSEDTLQFTF